MMLKYFSFIFFLILLSGGVYGQTTRDADAPPAVPFPRYQAEKVENKGLFNGFFKRLFKKKEQDPVAEFRQRMKKVYKQKAKEEKLAEKPQYSNPLYFGHKKPPKKRPLGKRKYCEECGIVH